MFHEGDLQSGIARALQEQKSVVCFVRDDGDESQEWETERLQAPDITSALEEHAVSLRLAAGSTEAGYLSAVYPVSQTPLVVVIQQGQLREALTPGITAQDFKSRLLSAVAATPPSSVPTIPSTSSASTPETLRQLPNTTEPEPASAVPDNSSRLQNSTAVQDMMKERRARLEAEQKAREDREKAARIAKGKARKQEDNGNGNSGVTPVQPHVNTYAQQQKQRLKEAKEERERILRRLEDDKIERRQREEQRRAQAREEASLNKEAEPLPGTTSRRSDCSLQVRLLDGSSIRQQFSSNDELAAVRQWIDGTRSDGNVPYNLKQILAPLPNRNLSASDEAKSLRELDLIPSATLVLSPAQNYSTAGAGGIAGRASTTLSSLYSAIAGLFLTMYGMLASVLRLSGQESATTSTLPNDSNKLRDQPAESGSSSSTNTQTGMDGSAIRIRTLRDQRQEREDQQLYNGNQLNFEPNTKAKDEEQT